MLPVINFIAVTKYIFNTYGNYMRLKSGYGSNVIRCIASKECHRKGIGLLWVNKTDDDLIVYITEKPFLAIEKEQQTHQLRFVYK